MDTVNLQLIVDVAKLCQSVFVSARDLRGSAVTIFMHNLYKAITALLLESLHNLSTLHSTLFNGHNCTALNI